MRKAATAATATAGGAHADSPQLLSRRQEVAVLKLVQKAAECVSSPPEAAFVQLGGEPGPPSAGQQGAAQQFRDDAAAGLRLARALVAVAEPALQLRGPSSSDDQDGRGASRGGSDELGGSGAAPRTVTHGVQIEELPNDGVDVSDAELKIQAEAAVDAALLACAAHLADPALAAPWSSCGTEVAAAGLLDELVRRVTMVRPPYRRLSAVEGSLAMMSPGDVKMQDLLCARLPALLPALRAMLGHQQRHDLNSRPFKPYAGPNAYQRCLVARRLSRLVRCLTHPFIGSQVTMLLPAVLAVLDDPSAAVARHGIVALRHCAAQALGADLRWQRELLLQVCHQLVVGCRDELWADALPAAAELAVAVEGPDPRASGYHDLLPEMLTEVERTAHVAQRRCVFMAAATPLVAAMGLAAVRHFGRLMPLVLEWLHAGEE